MAEKEYIEREAILETLNNHGAICGFGKYLIEKFPAADVVSVVRCRDCKFFGNGDCSVQSVRNMYPDDFCSYGERKELDNDTQ